MSTKLDDEFVATAVDPVRRRTAIAELARRRNISMWIVAVLTIAFFGFCIFGSRQPDAYFIFIVFLAWIQLFKHESDLKLLRVVDRLQNYERTVA